MANEFIERVQDLQQFMLQLTSSALAYKDIEQNFSYCREKLRRAEDSNNHLNEILKQKNEEIEALKKQVREFEAENNRLKDAIISKVCEMPEEVKGDA